MCLREGMIFKMIEFTKMHGLGNDYIYINALELPVDQPGRLAIAMSDRHFGIGADGLVLIEKSQVADFKMRMFNADGSEGEMCGNAARCIGKYVFDKGITDKLILSLETKSGIKELALHIQGEEVGYVTVNMGVPIFKPALIPVDLPGDAVVDYLLQENGHSWRMTCINMGNPHGVFFVSKPVDEIDVDYWGPYFENHPLFPEKINVEFVEILERNQLKMRVWERGSGETLACGTGASAAVVAAALQGLGDREATVQLKGGDLKVKWRATDNHVFQTGPAAFVFEGIWDTALHMKKQDEDTI